jgi:phycocyanobilin:ferredoxin oxidoreductase
LTELPQINFSQPRELPEWGHIFSDFCLFVRPSDAVEEAMFLDRVEEYLELHCRQAIASVPATPEKQQLILAGQRNYCHKQQQNDKTRRVLEKAFGAVWAQNYMTTVLFDFPEI